MYFNSLHFAAFFVVVLFVGVALRRAVVARNVFLLLASYYFYGCWDERFLLLLFISTTIDYFAGLGIAGRPVSWRARGAATGGLTLATVLLIGVNWAALTSEGISALRLWPADPGGRLAAGLSYGFAIVYPLLNAWLVRLPERARRRAFLLTSLVGQLGMLAVFKYYNFFADSAAELLREVGLSADLATLNIILPVGISFYTFQTLSYTIDVYRRKLDAEDRFVNFALFVAFFPQLVAGPIERASHLLPQVRTERLISLWHMYTGFYLICWGLFKKVVLADNVAKVAATGFGAFAEGAPPEAGGAAYLAALAFAIQIYCDFSGYTDIARGSARMLGFDLMRNFDLPYFATNPSDFWRRWHISLSTWLRDYLYIPLGGDRKGRARTYFNLMATMTLGGLWHGAAWTYVLWGVYHGVLLCGYRLMRPRLELLSERVNHLVRAVWTALSILFFFQLTLFGWLLFRAESIAQVCAMSKAIFTSPGSIGEILSPQQLAILAATGLTLLLVQFVQGLTKDHLIVFRLPAPARAVIYAAALLGFVIFGEFGETPFIYFQF